MLLEELETGRYDYRVGLGARFYYALERAVGQTLLRRRPPRASGERLLNLGCGPHIFEGWVNADDYAFKKRLQNRRFRPNWSLDISKPWLCDDGEWDGIFTESVIEYFEYTVAIAVLRECLRTLKPGAWLRISAPDLKRYTAYYRGEIPTEGFPPFPHPALGVAYLTQKPFHVSTWDAGLMTGLLREIGFIDAREVGFREGSDPRLARDDPDKRFESVYVEARKPAA